MLAIKGRSARDIFGMHDELKLCSCATLFAEVSLGGSVFHLLIESYFGGKADVRTRALLGGSLAAD
ncbi:DUF1810 domain-containing protein [Thiohalocapsa marina]|uniref:DUF1810 domain-containing protein n=1 Tax=Thiohalocapsa marina TaxID=424902 RepID=A0A5M8FEA7_9GAMM|nr:DUF1810 domain-containing protein [Thiohalocapsa marina]